MISDVVLWFPNADMSEKPCPAIVTGEGYTAGSDVLELKVIEMGMAHLKEKVAVRHISDPKLQENQKMRERSGGWCSRDEYAEHMKPKLRRKKAPEQGQS